MCSQVIIGSNVPLPTIRWDDEKPSLHISEEIEENILEAAVKGMDSKYFYSVGSFLGCSCGLSFGKWSIDDPNEEHSNRVRDVEYFMKLFN